MFLKHYCLFRGFGLPSVGIYLGHVILFEYRPSAQAYRTSPLKPGAPKVEIPGLHNTQFPSPLLHSTKVFFFNMITEMPKDFLVNLFGIYGEVDKLEIQTDNDGRFLGMGFLNFKEVKSVRNVFNSLHDAEIHGKKLQIKTNL